MRTSFESYNLPDGGALEVPDIYYRRHLGLPVGADLDDHLVELTEHARAWYRENSTPWTASRQIAIDEISGDVIHLEGGIELASPVLAEGLTHANANELVVVAATAGKGVDERIAAHWEAEHPEEAMFLNSYAIAAVEHLRWTLGEHLSQTFRERGMTVLPHYSPGYEGWDLADQHTLFALIDESGDAKENPLKILESGCLLPMKSTLAAYGITCRTDLGPLEDYWTFHQQGPDDQAAPSSAYAFPERTLARWQEKRLSLTALSGGKVQAMFRTDGSTCTNMGVPLQFIYQVSLQREENSEYRITDVSCCPAEESTGYQSMCAYLGNPDRFMAELEDYRPLVGRPLSEAIGWKVSTSPAGCLCTRPSQDHKWRIVLQTVHYALQNKLTNSKQGIEP